MSSKEIGVILKRFESPDEVRVMQKGKFELVHIGGMTIGRATYEPVGNGANTSAQPSARRVVMLNTLDSCFPARQPPPSTMAALSSYTLENFSTFRRFRTTAGSS